VYGKNNQLEIVRILHKQGEKTRKKISGARITMKGELWSIFGAVEY
jgi:hypothetical protein